MTYDYIFKTKFFDGMSKNDLHCRIIRSRTSGATLRYDIELEDGSQMHGVYAAEIHAIKA